MKLKTLIAGTVVMLLCGGLTVCFAQEAPKAAPSVAPESAPSAAPEAAPAPKPKHHRRHHHRKGHAQKEFTEQQLQEYQAQPPSK